MVVARCKQPSFAFAVSTKCMDVMVSDLYVLTGARYNSVVFQTTATNAVDMTLVQELFLTTRGGWRLEEGDDKYRDHFQDLQDAFLDTSSSSASPFENISTTECIHRYQTSFVRAGNVVAVVSENYSGGTGGTIDNSTLVDFGMNVTEMWFGPRFVSNLSCKFIKTGDYVSHSHFADCLSESSPERCQVQLNQSILYVVIACNIIKVTLMLMVLGRMNYETIVTIGDAIQTFILEPDISTQHCCLMTSHGMKQALGVSEARRIHRHQSSNHVRWYSVVSGKRWFCSLLL